MCWAALVHELVVSILILVVTYIEMWTAAKLTLHKDASLLLIIPKVAISVGTKRVLHASTIKSN